MNVHEDDIKNEGSKKVYTWNLNQPKTLNCTCPDSAVARYNNVRAENAVQSLLVQHSS